MLRQAAAGGSAGAAWPARHPACSSVPRCSPCGHIHDSARPWGSPLAAMAPQQLPSAELLEEICVRFILTLPATELE